MSNGWFAGIPRWTPEQLKADVIVARNDFRARRLGEPAERYLAAYDASYPHLLALIGELKAALKGGADSSQLLRQLWKTETGRIAFRYLGAPPISKDDLETLAEAKMNVASAKDVHGCLERLLGVVREIIDPRRFPWIAENREPTDDEIKAAVLASTTLTASKRVEVQRRKVEKATAEGPVKELLVDIGWKVAVLPPRGIQNLLNDSPAARTFTRDVNLGNDNADVVVRLDDGRLLAIECKGSNSEVNSRKRLNKEAVQNARAWLQRFGTQQVIPAVVLQGVFKLQYVVDAQDTPMAVFWVHRLDDLRRAVASST